MSAQKESYNLDGVIEEKIQSYNDFVLSKRKNVENS